MSRAGLPRRLALAGLLAAALPAAALAAPEIRPRDQDRLDAFDPSLGRALSQALADGAEADVATLAGVMRGHPLPLGRLDLVGDWRCRMLKLGRNLPLVVYSDFRCRITPEGEGWRFEKLSGSQRSAGHIAIDEGRLVYLGAGYVAGEAPVPYADLPEVSDPRAIPQVLPEVAVVQQVAGDRVRMMFPLPVLESEFNILELRR